MFILIYILLYAILYRILSLLIKIVKFFLTVFLNANINLLKSISNGTHYRFNLIHYLVVEEAQDAITSSFKIGSAPRVILLLFQVLASVHFNDEILTRSAKINELWPNRMSPAEAYTLQPMRTQISPQL